MKIEQLERIIYYSILIGLTAFLVFFFKKYLNEETKTTTKLELELYNLGIKIDSTNYQIKTLNMQADKISNQVNVTLTNVKQIKKQRNEKIHYVSNLSDSASFVFFTGWISQDFSAGR